MVDELGVPEVWLHECRALHAKTCKADHKVAYYLLKANHWQSAHNALMKGVVAGSNVLTMLLLCFLKRPLRLQAAQARYERDPTSALVTWPAIKLCDEAPTRNREVTSTGPALLCLWGRHFTIFQFSCAAFRRNALWILKTAKAGLK